MSARQMQLQQILAQQRVETWCIGCGCTETAACPGGCFWTGVNQESGAGLCSRCTAKPLEELEAQLEMDAG